MDGTRVLLIPIFRRYWLWHAWGSGAAATAAAGSAGRVAQAQAVRPWREGRNLEEKAQLVGQTAGAWVSQEARRRRRRRSTVRPPPAHLLPGPGLALTRSPHARAADPEPPVDGVAQAGDGQGGHAAQPRLPVRLACRQPAVGGGQGRSSHAPPQRTRRCMKMGRGSAALSLPASSIPHPLHHPDALTPSAGWRRRCCLARTPQRPSSRACRRSRGLWRSPTR